MTLNGFVSPNFRGLKLSLLSTLLVCALVFCQIDPSRGTFRSLISGPYFRTRLIAAHECLSLSIDEVTGLGSTQRVLISKIGRDDSHIGCLPKVNNNKKNPKQTNPTLHLHIATNIRK